MTNILKGTGLVIAGVVVGLLASVVMHGQTFGGVYSQVSNYFQQGINVGPNGRTINNEYFGTCTGVATSTTMAVGGLYEWTCTDNRVTAGDNLQAMFANSSAGALGGLGFSIENVAATTSGQFGVRIRNELGIATSSVNNAYMQINYVGLR